MALFLSILKIIGIVLLVILAVLIVLVLLILFVPLRYKCDGYADIDEKDINAKASVTWLLHLVTVRFKYISKDDKTDKSLVIRVLGIKIMDILDPEEKAKKAKKKQIKKQKEKLKEERKKAKEKGNKTESENDEPKPEETGKKEDLGYIANNDLSGGFIEDIDIDDNDPDGKDLSIVDKVITFIEKIYDFIVEKADYISDLTEDSAENAADKIEDILKTIDAWICVLSKEKTVTAIGNVKDAIIKLLWHIRPRKGSLYGELGMDDPGTTGKILGYYWMFVPLYAGIFTLVPVFDKKRIYFKGNLKGHIRLNHVLVIAWRFFFNKDFKYVKRIPDRVEYVKEHKK